MRGVLGLLALAGCNQIFDLRPTQAIGTADAQYFDSPVDAPFTCPPIGAPPPAYSSVVRQVAQDCSDYTLSFTTGVATARCHAPNDHVATGPINEMVAPIAGMTSDPGGIQYVSPRLSPEGDELFYLRAVSNNSRIERRARAGDGSWSTPVALTPNVPTSASIGTPSRGPVRRMFVKSLPGADVTEIEIAADNTWSTIATYGYTDLGVFYATSTPSLSADGLRLVWSGQEVPSASDRSYYATRGSLAERFDSFENMMGVPGAISLFMTEDCANVYFYAASAIQYVQQQ